MKCVVTKIVTPCLRESSIRSSQKLSRATGSTPDVGSSRIRDLRPVQHGDGQREPLPQAHREIPASASTCVPSPNRSTSSPMRAFALSGGR